MTLTPDGHTMYFLGRTPEDVSSDMYKSHKVDGKWQRASKVPEPISTKEYAETYPIVVSDGSLYFVSDRPEGVGKRNICRSQYLGNDTFDYPVSLGPVVNSQLGSGDTYVAPDEGYIIYGTIRSERGWESVIKGEVYWVDAEIIFELKKNKA